MANLYKGNEKNQLEFLDILSIISFIIQMNNNEELHKQSSNDDIMSELKKQDREFFLQIVAQNEELKKQNEEILKLLKNKT